MTRPTDPPMPSPEEATPGIVAALRAAGCVFAEEEARLLLDHARTPADLEQLVRRRVAGEPLEHLLGWAEFAGLRIVVGPGVFVPRRRTRLLVAETLAAVRGIREAGRRPVVVLDLCCGSGAVAAALATTLHAGADPDPGVEVHAADADPAAVRCARRNLDGIAEVHCGDLFTALPARLRGSIDVLAASPPYVPTDAVRLLPPEARDHEPRAALDGGPDGLDVVRAILASAPSWLRPGGVVLFDLGGDQAPAATALLSEHGFVPQVFRRDDLGATVVSGSSRTAAPRRARHP